MPGTLFVVASSLGNPADVSPRAVATLRDVDLVLAEDTRNARKLLTAHGIDRPTRSCFDANEAERAKETAEALREGKNIALISDAGTPTVSDPGFRVIRAAIEVGARVVPIPGPTAVATALVGAGLPTDQFFFAGFPPRKAGPRRTLLTSLAKLPVTIVFYESPHRVHETLTALVETFGADRPACIARELTKTHEEFVRDTLGALAKKYEAERPLGEVTLVVGGSDQASDDSDDDAVAARARSLLASGATPRDVADKLAAETGRPRRSLYSLVLTLADKR